MLHLLRNSSMLVILVSFGCSDPGQNHSEVASVESELDAAPVATMPASHKESLAEFLPLTLLETGYMEVSADQLEQKYSGFEPQDLELLRNTLYAQFDSLTTQVIEQRRFAGHSLELDLVPLGEAGELGFDVPNTELIVNASSAPGSDQSVSLTYIDPMETPEVYDLRRELQWLSMKSGSTELPDLGTD